MEELNEIRKGYVDEIDMYYPDYEWKTQSSLKRVSMSWELAFSTNVSSDFLGGYCFMGL